MHPPLRETIAISYVAGASTTLRQIKMDIPVVMLACTCKCLFSQPSRLFNRCNGLQSRRQRLYLHANSMFQHILPEVAAALSVEPAELLWRQRIDDRI